MRIIDKLDKVPADVVAPCWSTRPGCTAQQADAVPRAGRDPQRRTRPSSSGCGRSASRTSCWTTGSTNWPRWSTAARRWPRPVRPSRPTCASPAGWTTTPARCSRRGWPASSSSARSAPAAGTTRWPATGRTTYPGVGISLGVTRMLMPLFQRGLLDRVAVGAVGRAGRAARRGRPRALRRRSRRRCGRAAIAAEVAPQRAEVRQADPLRRAARHPVRLVPEATTDRATR